MTAAVLFALALTPAAEPGNFAPPPAKQVADNFSPPKLELRDYAACLKAVEAGKTAFLTVGPYPLRNDYHTDEVRGIAPGRYKCWKDGRGNVMLPVDADDKPKIKAQADADPNADHQCPKCGTHQFVQSGL